ncbi:MAG: hypothetical protein SPG03_00510 [Veillonella caviae]|uniref:hypothetical protein n=1 Tax=Veillonella caviae TaxID=248316 RepID=UPI002A910617|nr:hypothetical protein [Veillonella caviae]MCF0158023.1 hypothetical protein [Veillonella sp.]MDY5480868.1 hypothetical protein [Veillonella caviae]
MNDPTGKINVNWLALWACVYGNSTPDKALRCMGVKLNKTKTDIKARSILNAAQTAEAKQRYQTENISIRDLAELFNTSYGTMRRALAGVPKFVG